MNRKAKAMEEAHRIRSSKPSGPVNSPSKSPVITLEEMLEQTRRVNPWNRMWDAVPFDRKFCDRTYKNGAKIYDQAMAILNSPLVKALK